MGLGSAGEAEVNSSQAKEALALTYTRATVLILLADAHEDQPLFTVGGRDTSSAT